MRKRKQGYPITAVLFGMKSVAMMFVLAFVPFKWTWWLAAFVLFRLFDALKPPPVGWFDKNLHGGLGIMADDMAAAVMTLIVLQIAMLF